MTQDQYEAVSIALLTLAGKPLAFDSADVKNPIEKAIAHRSSLPSGFKDKCLVVLHEAITHQGFFSDGAELVQS